MDKYAAAQVAQEYYNAGQQAALEKLASSILTSSAAKRLADALGQQIGKAGKTVRSAGPMRRASGVIPGTQMNRANRVLQGGSGRANVEFAESAHNLGYGGGLKRSYDPMYSRYSKGIEQGQIPSGHFLSFSPAEQAALGLRDTPGYVGQMGMLPLSQRLARGPQEAELLASMNMQPLKTFPKGRY